MAKKNENEAHKSCAACKKALRIAKRYYRNNSYFCNLNCFKKKVAADIKKAQEAAA